MPLSTFLIKSIFKNDWERDFMIEEKSTHIIRLIILANVGIALTFILNNFLTNGFGFPGPLNILGLIGLYDTSPANSLDMALSGLQLGLYGLSLFFAYSWVERRSHADDVKYLDAINTYIIAACFWVVLLIGLVDIIISFIRVHDIHSYLFSDTISNMLNQPKSRGIYIHLPIIVLGFLAAIRLRHISFVWLALMVVIAEMVIVIARFVFSYEQTFMGDLVRFWYAALFLFASAQTLVEEGHVRVDVLYAGFSKIKKNKVNMIGAACLGIPLCWAVMICGIGTKNSVINSPMLNFETSMSGYGMYVKYLMAAFLLIFAITMLIQFSSHFLSAYLNLKSGQLDDADNAGENA